jgi:hypothetical protein
MASCRICIAEHWQHLGPRILLNYLPIDVLRISSMEVMDGSMRRTRSLLYRDWLRKIVRVMSI